MKKVSLPQDDLSILTRQIFTLNGLLLKAGHIVATAQGLTVAKWHVLARANYKPRTVADIARYIGISRQAVQRTADSLAEDGLLRYVPNPNDMRAQLAAITAKGARALDAIYKADAVWSKNLSRQFKNTDLKAAIDSLNRIIPAVSAGTGGHHENA